MIMINTIDQRFPLGTGEFTTLRQLASDGRLLLRRSGSYPPAGSNEPRKALWTDVVNPRDPNATEGFEISRETYDALVAMGVPDATLPGVITP